MILDRIAARVKAQLPEGSQLVASALVEEDAGLLALIDVRLADGKLVTLETRDGLQAGMN